MPTNTSRGMTSFVDYPPPTDWPLHPSAEQVHAYLHAYARHFEVTPTIRLNTPVRRIEAGWRVDGERFDAVIIASGRFRRPRIPQAFAGLSR